MGCGYDLVLQGVLRFSEIILEPLQERLLHIGYIRLDLGDHVIVDLVELLVLHPVEQLRLEVRKDRSLDEREHTVLDKTLPVDLGPVLLFLVLAEDPCYGGLVRLLIQFRKIDRTQMVVPSVHVDGIEETIDQIHVQIARHGVYLPCPRKRGARRKWLNVFIR